MTTYVQRRVVRDFLCQGYHVIVADANLVDEHLNAWKNVAAYADADFSVHDFTHVPIDECVRRDAERPPYESGGPCSGRSVGEKVIRGMWEKYRATHPDKATATPEGR